MEIFKKHELIVYLIMTFILTWVFWIIGFTSNNSYLYGSFRIIGSFGPSIAAIIFTGCSYGMEGIKKLLKKLTIWRINPVFYAFIFLFTASSIYLSLFICRLLGINYKAHINYSVSGFQLNSPIMILICFFAFMIFGGPLGEEIGWRGVILPKLQQKFSPVISGIISGVIWTCWHIPMFYFNIPGYKGSFGGFIGYLLETIWLSILYTWLYNNVKGSLLIMILFHTIDNFVMSVCINDFMMSFNTFYIIFWIIRLIVLFCVVIDMHGMQISEEVN